MNGLGGCPGEDDMTGTQIAPRSSQGTPGADLGDGVDRFAFTHGTGPKCADKDRLAAAALEDLAG